MRILKFGGSSVGSPDALRRVISIVESKQKDRRLVVVVSALRGITDQLIETASLASSGDERFQDLLQQIDKRHIDTINDLFPASKRSEVITSFKLLFNELEDVLQGVWLIRELTLKTLDFVVGFGERFSAQILASALQNQAISSLYTDARNLIKTDNNFGAARVLTDQTYQNIQNYLEENDESVIVATGFISSTLNEESTTLGRGGSDYTASIFGAALNAEVIEIWTDVDGLMTADPRKVKNAFSVEFASYEEAMELSHFGAKVIYPPTIQPALKSEIPIVIKNTFKPEHPGTQIKKEVKEKGGIIRGLSSIENVSLITIKGSGMIGVTGVASRIFGAMAKVSINIILITQSSSEHTITVAVLPGDAEIAKKSISDEFSEEFKKEILDEIRVENDLSIVAVVGDNMRQIPGIAGRVFNALGRNGINIVAIAQGSSERNISFVIDRKNEKKAMNTLHDAFFLAGVKTMNIFLVGVGLIGSTLLKMLSDHAQELYNEYQIDVNIKGLANSKKMLLSEESISLSDWETHLQQDGRDTDLEEFVDVMRLMNLPNSIFVDCTASPELKAFYNNILSESISVVTPNKLANSTSQELFDQLHETAKLHNCAYRYETNVGAGLPVIGTINEMVTTGDHIHKIEGVLSGTLSYLFNSFDDSVGFSDLVKKAKEMGYTEPDPREDLNGFDVGRKLLILARVAGYQLDFDDIDVQNLVPEEARDAKDIDEFFEKLKEFDSEFEAMWKEAADEGKKLCYIARFENGEAEVKLETIASDHPFYNLSGSDNILAIYSSHYDVNPLVVKGPGAGANVTAAGIIADILRVANTKAYSNAGF
ncbi:bifunctional aspartate kinase/homoserine dehydrogenase I [Rhodohalobacter sp. 614A]|uniref:bifunctional aspartate kinase/homoserine dehydrogenase I n=1 Tax=Rhodohalobacter sp. 614A TaxID=2908649 RepID=UPI001F3FFEAC|nr:bifunctional aspartate kinase/homoserine dehydrogenase I [Rhodohalobacter sp. 614A]